MGLDQYAYRIKEDGERTEIAYWRKHNRLQGWMENLYIKKGGIEEFNCVDVEIGWDDVIRLQEDINNRSLPYTGGFFFGNDSYGVDPSVVQPEDNGMYRNLQADLEFIDIAKLALDCNDKVIYTSWW
jgi:hypothetical protein